MGFPSSISKGLPDVIMLMHITEHMLQCRLNLHLECWTLPMTAQLIETKCLSVLFLEADTQQVIFHPLNLSQPVTKPNSSQALNPQPHSSQSLTASKVTQSAGRTSILQVQVLQRYCSWTGTVRTCAACCAWAPSLCSCCQSCSRIRFTAL